MLKLRGPHGSGAARDVNTAVGLPRMGREADTLQDHHRLHGDDGHQLGHV